MSNRYSVWTHNTSPEWLAKNGGVTDMVLAGGMDAYNANFAALRLQELTPGREFIVRDENNNDVGLVPQEDAYRVLVEEPRRRSIGLIP